MKRTNPTENSLIRWSLCVENPPHDPSWLETNIVHQIINLGDAKAGRTNKQTDGGMCSTYQKHRDAIQDRQKVEQINRVVNVLKNRRADLYRVVLVAFLSSPGYIKPVRQAAEDLNLKMTQYRVKYAEALSFIDGALITV